jgi:hypothetical protein
VQYLLVNYKKNKKQKNRLIGGQYTKAYCGVHPELGAQRFIFEFVYVIMVSDFVEFFVSVFFDRALSHIMI